MEEHIEALKKLGLTTYEARAYISLLELKRAGAYAIAQHAKIPTSKIYAVLSSLCSKGFALEEPAQPRVYLPENPEKACLRAFHSKLAELQEAKNRALELSDKYSEIAGGILKVAGWENIKSRIEELVLKSSEIMVYLQEYNPELMEMLKKSKLRLIVSSEHLKELYANLSPRVFNLPVFHRIFLVGDYMSILFPIMSTKSMCYVIYDGETVEMAKKTFEELWKNAK